MDGAFPLRLASHSALWHSSGCVPRRGCVCQVWARCGVTRVFLWQVWDRLPFGTYEMIGESSAAIDEANTDDTGGEARGPG